MADITLLSPPDSRWGTLAPIGRQLLRALPLSLLVLGVAIVLNFALPRLAPGDPIDFLIPAEQASLVSPEQREQLERLGSSSEWEHFGRYLVNRHGDLGISPRTPDPSPPCWPSACRGPCCWLACRCSCRR